MGHGDAFCVHLAASAVQNNARARVGHALRQRVHPPERKGQQRRIAFNKFDQDDHECDVDAKKLYVFGYAMHITFYAHGKRTSHTGTQKRAKTSYSWSEQLLKALVADPETRSRFQDAYRNYHLTANQVEHAFVPHSRFHSASRLITDYIYEMVKDKATLLDTPETLDRPPVLKPDEWMVDQLLKRQEVRDCIGYLQTLASDAPVKAAFESICWSVLNMRKKQVLNTITPSSENKFGLRPQVGMSGK